MSSSTPVAFHQSVIVPARCLWPWLCREFHFILFCFASLSLTNVTTVNENVDIDCWPRSRRWEDLRIGIWRWQQSIQRTLKHPRTSQERGGSDLFAQLRICESVCVRARAPRRNRSKEGGERSRLLGSNPHVLSSADKHAGGGWVVVVVAVVLHTTRSGWGGQELDREEGRESGSENKVVARSQRHGWLYKRVERRVDRACGNGWWEVGLTP